MAAATGAIPDEGLTVGSRSIEFSGPAIRAACAETRALFTAAAAGRLGCAPAELDVVDGAFLRDGAATGLDYWGLASDVDLARPATGEIAPKTPDRLRQVGRSEPRIDLPAKVFGAAFLHDVDLPGMRHARILRQPSPGARLQELDEATRDTENDPKLELVAPPAEFAIWAVEDRLVQVLRNLIGNAQSFSPPRGRIVVRVRDVGDMGELSVEDEGPGIPEANLEHIFDRFYSERPSGESFGQHSGLGLSISRQIVEALHGQISAENRRDLAGKVAGARFIVRLPKA